MFNLPRILSQLYNASSSRGFQSVALNKGLLGILDLNIFFHFKWKEGNVSKYVNAKALSVEWGRFLVWW